MRGEHREEHARADGVVLISAGWVCPAWLTGASSESACRPTTAAAAPSPSSPMASAGEAGSVDCSGHRNVNTTPNITIEMQKVMKRCRKSTKPFTVGPARRRMRNRPTPGTSSRSSSLRSGQPRIVVSQHAGSIALHLATTSDRGCAEVPTGGAAYLPSASRPRRPPPPHRHPRPPGGTRTGLRTPGNQRC